MTFDAFVTMSSFKSCIYNYLFSLLDGFISPTPPCSVCTTPTGSWTTGPPCLVLLQTHFTGNFGAVGKKQKRITHLPLPPIQTIVEELTLTSLTVIFGRVTGLSLVPEVEAVVAVGLSGGAVDGKRVSSDFNWDWMRSCVGIALRG